MGNCLTHPKRADDAELALCTCVKNHTTEFDQRRCRVESNISRLLSSKEPFNKKQLISLNIPEVCRSVTKVFLSEDSLLRLDGDFIVVGDLHGQLNGLQHIIHRFGSPRFQKYLFLGDYVDRGKQSIETLMFLLSLKLCYPENVFLIRGNHESEAVNELYGFAKECKRRLPAPVWESFWPVYDAMPFAAVLNKSIFCVHGGIGPQMNNLEKINQIKRPVKLESQSLHELVWSDPAEPRDENCHWTEGVRGKTLAYGKHAANQFLGGNNLKMILRSHQYVPWGYQWRFEGKLLTIFSAMCYEGDGNEPAVFISRTDGDFSICQYNVYK